MRWLVLLLLFSASGCIGSWRRADLRSKALKEIYDERGFDITRAQFHDMWSARDRVIYAGCVRFDEPCRTTFSVDGKYCFELGAEKSCFRVTERDGRTFVIRESEREAAATERWLYERLDADFREHAAEADETAELQAAALETPPTHPSSFWMNARATLQVPEPNFGLQAQAGYRHWFEHYFLLAVGGGYENALIDGTGMAKHSVLLTARLEFSAYDEHAPKRANLPIITGYFGMTGVIGVDPTASWTTRVFMGVSALLPISIEFGYALTSFDRTQQVGNFYVAVGLGF